MAPLTRARALLPGWRAAVVCMLIGVLLTIAVSWVLAVGYGRVFGGWSLLPGGGEYWVRSEQEAEALRRLIGPTDSVAVVQRPPAWEVPVPADWPPPFLRNTSSGIGFERIRAVSLTESMGDITSYTVTSQDAGLPLRSMTSGALFHVSTFPPTSAWHSGIDLGNGARLPLKPMWPGFLANTAYYATLTWAVVLAVRTLRNRFRLKPGQCPHCRYDATGLTQCPECGTFLIVRRASKS